MEYTHLSDFRIRSGDLSIWTPELASPDSWHDDERPLASVHAQYLGFLDPDDPQPGRGRWIGTIFEMDAPLDAHAWARTLELWHDRHEGFRTTVAPTGDGDYHRITTAPGTIRVTSAAVADLTDGEQINEFLCDALELRLSALVWPHLLVATVAHDTDDFTVLVAADHSVLDAYSQAVLILELRTLYTAVTTGGEIRDSSTFGSPADFAAIERAAAEELTPDSPAVAVWRDFLGTPGSPMPRFGAGMVAELDGEHAQPSVSRTLLTIDELEEVEARLDQLKHRLSVTVFAALAVAWREVFGQDRFRTVMPIATRPDLSWLESMGWFVNVVPVDITLPPGADMVAALTATRAALKRGHICNDASWGRSLAMVGAMEGPTFGASFLDIRMLPDYELVADLRGRTLRAVSYSTEEVYFWVVRGPEGLYVSTRYPAGLPAEVMDRYLTEFARAMYAVTTIAAPASVAPAADVSAALSAS
ncbi:condensation domain-containing protein [Nocardia caishijiensis]|uniref:Condensation domain-containing protein n=1 Tax=Nocardia caishijiensis TaxID=184756 RepID=A0ABQ6YLS2_9NOCA|nr:condensation domain-containing protein [Nocardia caishijiensis]KAF0846733.1 condensation domain-containing protein [Nocardia caishijiensis]